MINLKYIKENFEKIKNSIENRNLTIDLDSIILKYENLNQAKNELDNLRSESNEISLKFFSNKTKGLINQAKRLKAEIKLKNNLVNLLQEDVSSLIEDIPNLYAEDTPLGKSEENNFIVSYFSQPTEFDFQVKDHLSILLENNLANFEKAAKVSGNKFYYLKNDLIFLELALFKFVLTKLKQNGYEILSTPVLAKNSIIKGLGFSPRGENTQIYSIENSDLSLIGTSEITLGGYYANEVIDNDLFPLKLAGISNCFRTEAGSYGKEEGGLYRVHQFNKIEMFNFVKPENSNDALEDILKIEKEIYEDLGLPHRVARACSGELGNPAYKKYDIEVWFPSKNKYCEITSASNCTDYQSQRLNIKFRNNFKKLEYVHTLNGTAMALGRTIAAIVENFQKKGGGFSMPEALNDFF